MRYALPLLISHMQMANHLSLCSPSVSSPSRLCFPSGTHAVLLSDKRGNRALIAICAANIFVYFLTYLFYSTINKRRDRIWNSWTAKVRSA